MQRDAQRTFVDMLRAHASATPEKPYLSIDGEVTTFGAAVTRVERCASGLLALGIGPGSVVACMVPSCQVAVDLFFAAPHAGAVFTPINTAFRGEFLRHQLADSGAALILIEPDYLERLVNVIDDLTRLRVIVIRGRAEEVPKPIRAALGTIEIVEVEKLYLPPAIGAASPMQPGDFAYLFYTSGTTGLSKGVVIAQNYLGAFAQTIAEAHGYRSDDVIYGAVPLFHISGTSCVLLSLVVGSTTALDSQFHLSTCWQRVRDTRATAFIGVGAMLSMLWQLPRSPDDKTPLRMFTAAPIPAELHRPIEERYGFTLVSAYGLTEAMPIAMRRHDEDYPPGSAGRPNPAFDVALFDDDGEIEAEGAVGEICCRPRAGQIMFDGYLSSGVVRSGRDANGWFRTGDLGRFDSDLNLFFVDRKNYAIRRRGENISSLEIEQAVASFPGVLECAATGIPSELGEDDVKISVVFGGSEPPPPEVLHAHCVEHIPRFAVPRYIEYLDALPKNAVGRVQKFELVRNPVTAATWDSAARAQRPGGPT